MSQSLLTNSALECKQTTGGNNTLLKMNFSDATCTYQGATSGTKVKLANISDPTNSSDAATKNYVDGQLSGMQLGLAWKDSVRVRTTANLDATYASGTLTASENGQLPDIDGVSLQLDDRILLLNQSQGAHNGIYKVGSLGAADAKWYLDRTADANALTGAGDIRRAATYVEEGTLYSARGYVQSADISTLGTDDVVFSQIAQISEISANDGLIQSGRNIMVHTDETRGISIISDKVGIVDKGVTRNLVSDSCIDSLQLRDNSIIPSKLQAACINNANKFAGEVVDNNALAADAVSAVKIASNSVEERHIKDSNVTRQKIADDAINADKLATDSVTNDAIEDGAVTSSKIAAGQVKSTNIGSGECKNINIDALAITHDKIASNSVTSNKILAQNVTTDKLNQTVGAEAVTENTIRDNAVSHSKLAANAVEADNIKSGEIQEVHFSDGCVSERTLGTFNSLSVNGPISATSFIAGGSTAGQTAMSLCRSVMTKVSFDNASFPLTNDYSNLPNDNACIQFSYNDDIAAAFVTWVSAFQTDGTVNEVECIMKVRYYKNDGSQTLETDEHVFDHFEFQTGQDQYYPEGSQSVIVKQSSGSNDKRIGKIWVQVKKNQSGSVVVPQGADLNIISIVVADDSAATTISY